MYALDNNISGPYNLNLSISNQLPYVTVTLSGRGSFTNASKSMKTLISGTQTFTGSTGDFLLGLHDLYQGNVDNSETNVTNNGLCLKLHNSQDAKTVTQGTSTTENRILLDYNYPVTSTNTLKYYTPGNPYGVNSMTVNVYTGPLTHYSMRRSVKVTFYAGMGIPRIL